MLKRSVGVWNLYDLPLEMPMQVYLEVKSTVYGSIILQVSPLMTVKALYNQLEDILNGKSLYYHNKKLEMSFKPLYEYGILKKKNILDIY